MESTTLLNDGLALMMFGMGFVFVFLTLLVFATTMMSTLINTFVPEAPVEAAPAPRQVPAAGSVDPNVVKVLQAAIDQHRGR